MEVLLESTEDSLGSTKDLLQGTDHPRGGDEDPLGGTKDLLGGTEDPSRVSSTSQGIVDLLTNFDKLWESSKKHPATFDKFWSFLTTFRAHLSPKTPIH